MHDYIPSQKTVHCSYKEEEEVVAKEAPVPFLLILLLLLKLSCHAGELRRGATYCMSSSSVAAAAAAAAAPSSSSSSTELGEWFMLCERVSVCIAHIKRIIKGTALSVLAAGWVPVGSHFRKRCRR